MTIRLWSLHPSQLDTKGLVALWREALGAQKALVGLERGEKVGYQSHPQLDRFKATEDPVEYMVAYLWGIYEESLVRGYKFDKSKIVYSESGIDQPMTVTRGQMEFEIGWLHEKLLVRAPEIAYNIEFTAHELFDIVEGDKEPWERG